MDRPNILFISIDQHRYGAASYLQNPWVRTPNIDRLFRSGTAFSRAYCTDPVCAPARTSWTTGLYSSETGVPFNNGCLHGHRKDLGQLLRENGYYAAHCGKWHVDGRDVRESFHCLYYGGEPIGAGGAEYFDAATTHAALDFLSGYSSPEPFFLQVGYVNPHDICEYLHDHEYKDIPDLSAYGLPCEEDLPPLPANFVYDLDETATQRVFCRDPVLIHRPIREAVEKWTEYQWRTYIWNYYRYVEKADSEVGRLLNCLESSPHRDNTLIVFTSDHGESLASHRMFQKFTLYEESIHVQFIIADLGGSFGLRRGYTDERHLVSGVDILPTVCDYAALPLPADARGRSLRSLAEGRDVPWRDFVYVESNYWARAVIGERYKLVTEYVPDTRSLFEPPNGQRNRTGLCQLFDLEEDPGEMRNLAGDDRYAPVLAELQRRLAAQERELCQVPLSHGESRKTVSDWAEAMLAYYGQQPPEENT